MYLIGFGYYQMHLGVGEMGFIFCGKTASLHDKDPGEQSRANGPSYFVNKYTLCLSSLAIR